MKMLSRLVLLSLLMTSCSFSFASRTSQTQKYKVTVYTNNLNAGWVSGAGNYKKGESVVMLAGAYTNYYFDCWYNYDTGKLITFNDMYTFSMPGNDVNLGVRFI